MGYIRPRSDELTCYQESGPLTKYNDIGNDMVCVYGIDPGMPDRVRVYKARGYSVHLMTGIAWGNYDEYFSGKWDGREHWDECQRSRDGSLTGAETHTYFVPTISYVNFLTEKMKAAVDAGVEAIHVEEPEFLNAGGYSDAFKREYLLYYHEPWVAPYTSVDAHYKVAKLKAWLYRRAIERCSQELREYALTKYGRVLRFYVPTHSLLNYSQWKVMSPEGTLTDVPSLDGYKAQVWMGTSREANIYRGVYKERTFETAFLEYGVMQELVRGTGRTMWFDNDPIEDRPTYTWDSYRENYIKTLTGSLLQPHINRYQISPWPRRVFSPDMKYPGGSEDAKPIPEDYRTMLFNIFQMLGTFGTDDFEYDEKMPEVGVFLSDTALFQRSYPDDVMAQKGSCAPLGAIDVQCHANYDPGREQTLKAGNRLDVCESIAFPLFYGLALPLLKSGLPVRPVQLENITRYPGYLDDHKLLVLSYEFQKPQGADVNIAAANYVRDGGTLLYVGDGSDPFRDVRSWWNSGKNSYREPAEHLFELFGLAPDAADGVYSFGRGRFALLRKSAADLSVDGAAGDAYRDLALSLLGVKDNGGRIGLRRGEYLITARMDEAADDDPIVRKGLFVDMFDPELPVITEKTVGPDEFSCLLMLDRVAGDTAILGTSLRIKELVSRAGATTVRACGAKCDARMRLRLPVRPTSVMALFTSLGGEKAKQIPITFEWDEPSSSALFRFDFDGGDVELTII